MSWGIRITVLYLGFVALILTLVFTSMHQKEDLVAKDYYAQELKYQQRIDAAQNANALDNTISYEVHGKIIDITYPQEMYKDGLSGEIYFFRPSDASKDFKIGMAPSTEGLQSIDGKQLEKGSYKMQFSWKKNDKQFFKEEVIFIQ